MRRLDPITVAIAVGGLALGISTEHVIETRSDHDRIRNVEQVDRQLQDQLDQLVRTGAINDAGVQGTVDGLTERLEKLEREVDGG